MDNVNLSVAAKDRAARALAHATAGYEGVLTYDEMVGIVAHVLTNYAPEATVAAHALREWNNEDREVPKFAVNPDQSIGYAEIAQLVIDAADEYRKNHQESVTAPAPSVLAWPAPLHPTIPAHHTDAILNNACNVLTAIRDDILRIADREGHTVRRMDAACLENRAKMCRNVITALNTLRSDQCERDDCEVPSIHGSNMCAMHIAHEMFGDPSGTFPQ